MKEIIIAGLICWLALALISCGGVEIVHNHGQKPEISVKAVDEICTSGSSVEVKHGGPYFTCDIEFSM
jgi:hypothetical protein